MSFAGKQKAHFTYKRVRGSKCQIAIEFQDVSVGNIWKVSVTLKIPFLQVDFHIIWFLISMFRIVWKKQNGFPKKFLVYILVCSAVLKTNTILVLRKVRKRKGVIFTIL